MAITQSNEKQTPAEETSFSTRLLFVIFFIAVVCLTVIAGIFKPNVPPPAVVVQTAPEGIMGTECRLGVILKTTASQAEQADALKALQYTENQLRRWETITFSNWIENSEISQLNLGKISNPSEELAFVLDAAQAAAKETHGAFDVCCRPIIELWKQADKLGKLPTDDLILQAQNQRNQKDLGGIAKGRCIDLALAEITNRIHPEGAMVDIGGDVAAYGKSESGDAWTFAIVNPFNTRQTWGRFRLKTVVDNQPVVKAVCRSGSYFRGFDIAGTHYSHIIDPRTGRPVSKETAPVSVTVIADNCMTADIWATALCVLGKEGVNYLPPSVDAYLIFGEPENPEIVSTKGFPEVKR